MTTISNLNTTTSINAVAAATQHTFEQSFDDITSVEQFKDVLEKGSAFSNLVDGIIATGHLATYNAIAFAVQIAWLIENYPAYKAAFDERLKTLQVNYKGDNAYGTVTRGLFGKIETVQGANNTTSQKWVPNLTLSNKDRVIRHLMENAVPSAVVVETIISASVKVGDTTLKKLDALAYFDLQNHPLSADAQVKRTWGSVALRDAVKARQAAGKVDLPTAANFNEQGYGLAVIRKGVNGETEILYDASLGDREIMRGVRMGYAAVSN